MPTICPVRVSPFSDDAAATLARPKSISLGSISFSVSGDEDDVRRLDVAMHDAALVRRLERPAEPLGDVHGVDRRQPLLVADDLRQRRPAHVLHDDEGRIADDEIEEAGDVAVLDGGDGLRLVLKAHAEGRVGEQLRLEHLERDPLADGEVLGDEDLAHGAVAERLDELVAAGDDVADEQRLRLQQLDERFGQRVDARDGAARRLRKRRVPRTLRRLSRRS